MGKNWRRGSSEKKLLQKGNTIQAALWRDYGQLGDWASVGDKNKVSKAMAFRVAHGYEPKQKAIRAALGFPPIKQITAPVCDCGEVHLSKRCPNKPRPPAKPRTKWKQLAGWVFLAMALGGIGPPIDGAA